MAKKKKKTSSVATNPIPRSVVAPATKTASASTNTASASARASSTTSSSIYVDDERRAPIERIPYDLLEVICQWVLTGNPTDRVALLQFAISSAAFFAPAIRTAIRERNHDHIFIPLEPQRVAKDTWPWTDGMSAPTAEYVVDRPPSPWVKWLLVMPARTPDRAHVPLEGKKIVDLPRLSRKWTTVPISLHQLAHYTIAEDNQDYPIPRECRHLAVFDRWETFDEWPRYPDTLVSLELGDFTLVEEDALYDDVAAHWPPNLRSLTVKVSHISSNEVLKAFYRHLPTTLTRLILEFECEVDRYPDDVGGGCRTVLTRALRSMTALQDFVHDFLRVEDVIPIVDALSWRTASVDAAPMRQITLGLIVPNEAPAGEVRPPSRDGFVVAHLDIAVKEWENWDPVGEYVHTVLSTLQAPTLSLRVALPKWTEDSVRDLVDALVSPTLQDLKLTVSGAMSPPESIAMAMSGSRCFPLAALDAAALPLTLTSLSLTRCLSSRVLARFVDKGWTLPRTLTRISLTDNDLTAHDLKALQSLLPTGLQHLDLSTNKIHTLVTPLPPKLRTLNLAFNPTLSDELFPQLWILSLPNTLRRLDIRMCNLDDEFGRLFVDVRRRIGLSRAGWPKLQFDTGLTNFSLDLGYTSNRFSPSVYQGLVGASLE
ncbi:hypothetical protein GGF31_007211 [Allomyces arbusculus]|nr:hypothetical protein GGF31_007211 [Allomyces arbusculus]